MLREVVDQIRCRWASKRADEGSALLMPWSISQKPELLIDFWVWAFMLSNPRHTRLPSSVQPRRLYRRRRRLLKYTQQSRCQENSCMSLTARWTAFVVIREQFEFVRSYLLPVSIFCEVSETCWVHIADFEHSRERRRQKKLNAQLTFLTRHTSARWNSSEVVSEPNVLNYFSNAEQTCTNISIDTQKSARGREKQAQWLKPCIFIFNSETFRFSFSLSFLAVLHSSIFN